MVEFRDIALNISSGSDVSEILPLLAWGVFGDKKLPFRFLGILFLITSVLKIFSLFTAELYINNMPVYHLMALVEICFIYCFYSSLITGKVNLWCLAVLFSINLANSLFVQQLYIFNSLAWTFNMMIIIGIGLISFYELYRDADDSPPLIGRPVFVITSGWLIYASGSLFTYLLATEILSGEPIGFFKNAWIFQCISNILKNVIISYGFWLTRRK